MTIKMLVLMNSFVISFVACSMVFLFRTNRKHFLLLMNIQNERITALENAILLLESHK